MKSSLYHLQLNIDFQNLKFYRGLLEFMGWSVIFETDGVCGYKSGSNGDLWFVEADRKVETDYDAKGMNHLCLRVENIKDVDEIKDFLAENKVATLFGTPKHRPDFSNSDDETYYQIMFETPDKILFEIVYIGEK